MSKLQQKPPAFEDNEVLFGADPTEGIVAVEPVGEGTMRLFIRKGGRLTVMDEPFRPFMLVEDADLLTRFKAPRQIQPLSGDNPYRFLVLFESWGDCRKARSYLAKKTGETPSSPQAPYLYLSDPVQQFLILTGKTFFKGMQFRDVHRMALDIETACSPGFEFSNAARPEDRIISIALMDNRGYSEVLFGREMSEKEMLIALGERISELDPDVLEGHNLFNFDLEYVTARSLLQGVDLRWGRNKGVPSVRRSRLTVAERIIDYARMDIFGRHVVDTMFLLQYYDVTSRELESYGLKAAARHFGLADEDRTYIDGKEIQWYYDHEPDSLKRYNLDDVRETLALSELIGYPFFLQARIFPFSYQNIFVRGNATKINAVLLREYVRQRVSIPKPKGRAEFEGGYTDVFVKGVVRNVVHCDVASLYPSILISYGLKPSGDLLDTFLPLLTDLRTFRLESKRRALYADAPGEREYYQGLQQTFKILINSFYGYLGTAIHHFSDPQLAGEVTRLGRELIRRILDQLREEGAVPVEIDTDGIYFVPPADIRTEEDAKAMVASLSQTLPEGIDLEMDGRYPAMFSYKRKNYALLDEKGATVIKGSALRSRGMERYLREFLSDLLLLLLKGEGQKIQELCDGYMERIENHRIEISWLAKTESLRESVETYRSKVQAGKRNPAALYELAVASQRDYRAGDQLSHYVTGRKKNVRAYENCKLLSGYDPANPDENVPYYQEKLLALLKKFQEFMPPEQMRQKGAVQQELFS